MIEDIEKYIHQSLGSQFQDKKKKERTKGWVIQEQYDGGWNSGESSRNLCFQWGGYFKATLYTMP
jgi:CRISPR/Cas system-associated protein Csx1